MTTTRKIRRGRREWQRLMACYEAQGRSQRAFCHEHGLALSSFAKWRRTLAEECAVSVDRPRSPLAKALRYAMARVEPLQVFLTDPDVPIDTNHLERSLRAIPMGRRNWLFCWTEIGAEHVGIIQSLLVTCRLHGVNPYTYLVDVLQRVGQHPGQPGHRVDPTRVQ